MDGDTEPSLASLYDCAACGLLLATSEGTIRRANATFCSWVGFAPEALVNVRRFQDMLSMGGRVFHQTHFAPLMQMQGSVAEVKLDILHRDGHSIPILVSAIRRSHAGRAHDEIAVMIATDRQKYERELVLARRAAESANESLARDDRRKDEFLATLSHELRGPLAPISNVVELLRHKDIVDPELRWSREVLGRHVAHMARLVDDLLDVSRITQGKLRLRVAPFALRGAIEHAVEAVGPLVRTARQELTCTFPDDALWVNADHARIAQVVLNLLVNASKFSAEGGHIGVELVAEGAVAACFVRDSGVGIDPQHLGDVFEMFSQPEPAMERSAGGLGIGLALVRALVELHGGTATAFSAGKGHGSEFVVRLPLIDPPVPAEPPVPGPAAVVQPKGVLIVDDNVDLAESLALILASDGHRTQVVHEGESALKAVADGNFDFVLLDLGLPGLSGLEVARRVRSMPAGQAPVLVALTGWGQRKDIEGSTAAGFDYHLVKPVDFDKLNEILGTGRRKG